MGQTQTPNLFYKQGRMRDYGPPAADVYAGDVVVVGTTPFLAACDIASSPTSPLGANGTPTLGALH